MPLLTGQGSILLNNRRLLDGEYHIFRGAGQPPAWTGYIDVAGLSRDGLAEMIRWFEARPAGLVFTAQNGGVLPVSQLQRERYDLDAGAARFNILFAGGLPGKPASE